MTKKRSFKEELQSIEEPELKAKLNQWFKRDKLLPWYKRPGTWRKLLWCFIGGLFILHVVSGFLGHSVN